MIETRPLSISNQARFNTSSLEFVNYPLEISITKTAIDRIGFEFSIHGLYSTIHVFADMSCGQKKAICGINANFFGYIENYKSAFETYKKGSLQEMANLVNRLFEKNLIELGALKSIFNTKRDLYLQIVHSLSYRQSTLILCPTFQ